MASHTPGPWDACAGSSVSINEDMTIVPDHVRRSFVREDGRRVTEFICDCNTNLIESAANARLIAAAPELLEACRKSLNFEHGKLLCAETETDRECMNRVRSELNSLLKAAIAKAEDPPAVAREGK